MRIWNLFGLMISALLLAACANVDVDSSSAGNRTLASKKTCYINEDFAITDGTHTPNKSFQQHVLQTIREQLMDKGYRIVQSPAQAEITLQGSWMKGKVLNNWENVSIDEKSSSTGAHNAEYLTLSAITDGETQWSAQAPILNPGKDTAALMQSFPKRGDS